VITSVLVVSLGRLGDMYGRVKMYNLGFAIYTVFSLLLAITWLSARGRLVPDPHAGRARRRGGVPHANSSAILTDAFPEDQRGMASASIRSRPGGFVHRLVLGGILGPIQWRLISWSRCPSGSSDRLGLQKAPRGAAAHAPAHRLARQHHLRPGCDRPHDRITYGIQPYGGHTMGWTSRRSSSPSCRYRAAGGLRHHRDARRTADVPYLVVSDPSFTAGTISTFLAGIGRGGLMFILIIWLQGIWLPLHGYSFERTPLWAGIYMLPSPWVSCSPVRCRATSRTAMARGPSPRAGCWRRPSPSPSSKLLPVNFDYWAFAGSCS